MATKLRLARGGSKKRPFYRIVAADVRAPRDGAYIERLGTYNPLLSKESGERVKYDVERIKYWLGTGAEPTETVARFLRADGLWTKDPIYTAKEKIVKLAPRAQARKEAADAAAAEAAEAKKAAAEAPAEEATPEAPTEEAAPEAAAE